YMELLSQLTTTGTVTEEQFKDRFALLSQRSSDYRIVVVEDTVSNRVVGTGTLLIEFKFLRSCGKVGHIEDIVVHSSMQGKHLGHRWGERGMWGWGDVGKGGCGEGGMCEGGV
ncbi:unnamed protein product, partial [Closterium sp. Naga37s-1]